MDEVENGTGFSVYTASGISYYKIKHEKDGKQACHSYGNNISGLNSVLDLHISRLLSLLVL